MPKLAYYYCSDIIVTLPKMEVRYHLIATQRLDQRHITVFLHSLSHKQIINEKHTLLIRKNSIIGCEARLYFVLSDNLQ